MAASRPLIHCPRVYTKIQVNNLHPNAEQKQNFDLKSLPKFTFLNGTKLEKGNRNFTLVLYHAIAWHNAIRSHGTTFLFSVFAKKVVQSHDLIIDSIQVDPWFLTFGQLKADVIAIQALDLSNHIFINCITKISLSIILARFLFILTAFT